MSQIEEIIKNSAYKILQFAQEEIGAIEQMIYTKPNGKHYINCQIRKKEILLKPEEVIRQLFVYRLIHTYGYDAAQIQLEHGINFGREVKRADIIIFEKNRPTVEYIIVEVKKPSAKDGKEQLRSYCNATGATMGVWTNGEYISFFHRKDPNYFEELTDIPSVNQTIEDVKRKLFYIADLIEHDKSVAKNKPLSKIIVELEDDVLANAGVDVFEEVFKLIYTKLYDEMLSIRDSKRALEFRNYSDKDEVLYKSIQKLFGEAKNYWKGVFADTDKIELTPSHLAICISYLQNVKLFNSNLEIIDEAFEYLMSKSQKGEKGQYFTPRYVIDMCVKMLNPKITETMIDTAAGSCGFPMHTIFHVCGSQFTAEKKPVEYENYVRDKIFAIDFDEKAVRVARTLNLIAGDGKTNVIRLNTLDYGSWEQVIKDKAWQKKYNAGWLKLDELRAEEDSNRDFLFDIVMANPPFAGDIKETRLLHRYDLAKNSAGKYQAKVGRDILFIERNLQFLKDGGRMAIILPQGRFNNSSDKYIRDFIAERCRILAVVGLHGNVFKPHTGTKTSVLFVQKWHAELCPRRDDYPIFFATMQKPSKDNSGDKIFVTDASKNFLRDAHNHQIVDHDLFNHGGLTHDGVAEAFIEFAKREHLSFFDSGSFDETKYRRLSEELECTEILLSEVLKAEKTFRLDAEFFKKAYVKLFDKLNSMNKKYLRDYVEKIDVGFVGNMVSEYTENNSAPILLQTKNISEFEVNLSDIVHINENFHLQLKKSQVHFKDILIARSGSFGKASIWLKNFVANSADIIIVKADENLINPYYLVAFLNSFYGREQLFKFASGGLQGHVNLTILENLIVPNLNKDFQNEIEKIVTSAHKNFESADETYRAAEKILAQELDFENFAPSTNNVAIKSFSASFGKTGRLDAEFYQPKYDDIEYKLASRSSAKISDAFKLVKTACNRAAKNYNYIEIGDVNVSTGVAVSNFIATENLPDNAKIMTRAGDVLVSKVRPNRGAVAVLRENNLLVSGAFAVLRECGDFSGKVLQILLRLPIYRELMLKFNVGTSYPVIKDEDVMNLPLPVIEEKLQEKISALVEESFALRDESERLLGLAKKSVELAIERGEAAAVAFIGENLYNAGVEKI